ncbi:MAG TPA: Hint domain-containing protein, partial [Elusimicrobiota bacterium]|nr:Hint domain-containing protein [Elusimicrobiota bacterium]
LKDTKVTMPDGSHKSLYDLLGGDSGGLMKLMRDGAIYWESGVLVLGTDADGTSIVQVNISFRDQAGRVLGSFGVSYDNEKHGFQRAFSFNFSNVAVRAAVQQFLMQLFGVSTLAALEQKLKQEGIQSLSEIFVGGGGQRQGGGNGNRQEGEGVGSRPTVARANRSLLDRIRERVAARREMMSSRQFMRMRDLDGPMDEWQDEPMDEEAAVSPADEPEGAPEEQEEEEDRGGGRRSLADIFGPQFMSMLRGGHINWSQGSLTLGVDAEGNSFLGVSVSFVTANNRPLGQINVAWNNKQHGFDVVMNLEFRNPEVRRAVQNLLILLLNVTDQNHDGSRVDDLERAIRGVGSDALANIQISIEKPDGSIEKVSLADMFGDEFVSMLSGARVNWNLGSVSFGRSANGDSIFQVSLPLVDASGRKLGTFSIAWDATARGFSRVFTLNLSHPAVRAAVIQFLARLLNVTDADNDGSLLDELETKLKELGPGALDKIKIRVPDPDHPGQTKEVSLGSFFGEEFLQMLSAGHIDWSSGTLSFGRSAKNELIMGISAAFRDADNKIIGHFNIAYDSSKQGIGYFLQLNFDNPAVRAAVQNFLINLLGVQDADNDGSRLDDLEAKLKDLGYGGLQSMLVDMPGGGKKSLGELLGADFFNFLNNEGRIDWNSGSVTIGTDASGKKVFQATFSFRDSLGREIGTYAVTYDDAEHGLSYTLALNMKHDKVWAAVNRMKGMINASAADALARIPVQLQAPGEQPGTTTPPTTPHPPQGYCFAAGTPVLTRSGLKPIETIQVGEEVLSYNESKTVAEWQKVVATPRSERDGLVELRLNGEILRCSNNHRFYTVNRGWVQADRLVPGDNLMDKEGRAVVVTEAAVPLDGKAPVFNLTVANNRNYFAGRGSLLVHNRKMMDPDAGGDGGYPGEDGGEGEEPVSAPASTEPPAMNLGELLGEDFLNAIAGASISREDSLLTLGTGADGKRIISAQFALFSGGRKLGTYTIGYDPDKKGLSVGYSLEMSHPLVQAAVQRFLMVLLGVDPAASNALQLLEAKLKEVTADTLTETVVTIGGQRVTLGDLLGDDFVDALENGFIDWNDGTMSFGFGADGKAYFQVSIAYRDQNGNVLGHMNIVYDSAKQGFSTTLSFNMENLFVRNAVQNLLRGLLQLPPTAS